MRELIFRGKCTEIGRNYGNWIYGYLGAESDDKMFIAPIKEDGSALIGYFCDPDTISEYTGLTDKNGKKIFEGDILFCTHEIGMGYREFRGKVVYKAPRFFVDCGNVILTLDYDNGKPDQAIIGNIHDNPELLEDKL